MKMQIMMMMHTIHLALVRGAVPRAGDEPGMTSKDGRDTAIGPSDRHQASNHPRASPASNELKTAWSGRLLPYSAHQTQEPSIQPPSSALVRQQTFQLSELDKYGCLPGLYKTKLPPPLTTGKACTSPAGHTETCLNQLPRTNNDQQGLKN